MSSDKKEQNGAPATKLEYHKPTVKTEPLTTVAALCNGTVSAGRKASTGSPNFCSSSKLKS